MTFVEAISSGFNNYANFSGRSQRSAFWWWTLFYVIAIPGTAFIEDKVFGYEPPVLSALVSVGLLIPSIAVTVRRLHDTARSGWFILLGFVPLIGPIICWFGTANREPPAPINTAPIRCISSGSSLRARGYRSCKYQMQKWGRKWFGELKTSATRLGITARARFGSNATRREQFILFDAVRIAQFGQEGTWVSLEPEWKVTAPFGISEILVQHRDNDGVVISIQGGSR